MSKKTHNVVLIDPTRPIKSWKLGICWRSRKSASGGCCLSVGGGLKRENEETHNLCNNKSRDHHDGTVDDSPDEGLFASVDSEKSLNLSKRSVSIIRDQESEIKESERE